MAAGGSGAFTPPPPTIPPFDASWTRSPSNPVMSPTGWEGAGIPEPTVIYEAGTFKMINPGHSGSPWTTSQFGLATSADGATWTRYGGNPILGLGAGGQSGQVY